MPRTQPQTEKAMQAEWDFNTLANAEEIKSSPSRVRAARSAGRKIVATEKKALAVKVKVAKPAPKRSTK